MEADKYFRKYMRMYGPHFTKELCDFAVSLMEDEKGKITPITKKELEDKLKACGIELKYNKLHDAVYVANMCKADFLGSSIKSEEDLCHYIKDILDDADATDGYVFNRFYADTIFMNNPIEWDDMI
jgi:hypothetical protein